MAAVAEGMTAQEYLRQERRAERKHELRGGKIVEMPGVTRAHSKLQTRLARFADIELEDTTCEFHGSDLKVRTSEDRYLYPDGTISCDPRFEDGVRDVLLNPIVIFEILSPSTEGYDRGDKFHRYGQIESLEEYVLISSEVRSIDVFSRTEEGWTVRTYLDPSALVRLVSVNLALSFADLYKGVLE